MDFKVSPAVNAAFDGFSDVNAGVAPHGFSAFGAPYNQGHPEKIRRKFI